jgi:hypothetical protein
LHESIRAWLNTPVGSLECDDVPKVMSLSLDLNRILHMR